MPLPNLEKIVPTFELTIPSTGVKCKFRPFLVKEEKLLLMAAETREEEAILEATLQMIAACALSPLKVDTLSNFDIEYIFLQLRARSVSEIVEMAYKCHNRIPLTPEEYAQRNRGRKPPEGTPSTGSCDNVVKLQVNLDQVTVKRNPEHTNKIMLTPTLGIQMRYPNFKTTKMVDAKTHGIGEVIEAIAACVEAVFDDTNVYTNFQLPEIREWIEKLTQPQFEKVQQFFETMPVLAHDVEFRCEKCGYTETIHLEGLESFFG